jgi:hypothetical protein
MSRRSSRSAPAAARTAPATRRAAGRRLVEDLGLVKQRLDDADLLPVAAGQLAHRPVEVGLEALGQHRRRARAAHAADRGA